MAPNLVLDLRLVADDEEGQCERGDQQTKTSEAPIESSQAGTSMLPKLIVTLLCGVGLYASLFMLAKTRRAERGQLAEPSVVETPRARLYGGVPNALVGALYYPAVGVAIWLVRTPVPAIILLAAVAFAALTSLYPRLFTALRHAPVVPDMLDGSCHQLVPRAAVLPAPQHRHIVFGDVIR